MRNSVACFFTVLVLAAAGWMVPMPGETAHTGCGAWRWGVKTLTDSGAGQVALTPRQGQVDALRALPAPATPELDRERVRDVSFFVPNETELAILTGMPVGTEEEIGQAVAVLQEAAAAQTPVTAGACNLE